jgi:hypothetical protein
LRAIYHPGLRHELRPLIELVFQRWDQETGVEYIRTILYYLTRATERVSRDALEQVLLTQGAPVEQVMTTIAQEYIQQGVKRGLAQGLAQGLERTIIRILQRRFGSLPPELPNRLAELPAIVLEELLDEALMATSYEVFAGRLTAVENRVE